MTYILKLQKGEKNHTVFADDYSTLSDCIYICFNNVSYYATGYKITEINEQQVDESSMIFNREILNKLEAE